MDNRANERTESREVPLCSSESQFGNNRSADQVILHGYNFWAASEKPIQPDDDEGIEQVETDSWNNEQVHGGNVRRVVAQESSPSLAGWPPSFDHVLGNARLRDLKPELEQFAVDAWRAPKRIFDAHPPDQYAQPRVDRRSPSCGRDFQRQ